MRKLFMFVMVATLVAICGCKDKELNSGYDEIPSLMIANGQSEAEAVIFGCTWETRTSDGESASEIADGIDPLESSDTLPVISILPAYVSTVNPMNAYLMFEIVPDKVTARCWDTRLHIEDTAEVEFIDAYLENGTYSPDIILKLKNKNCIYEVKAEWFGHDGFVGTAAYCFRTDGEIVNWNNGIVIK